VIPRNNQFRRADPEVDRDALHPAPEGAEALSRKAGYVGAVAFSRDPATGDFGDAKVIRKFGEVPEDLSAL
jgi:hypothetical protein